MIWRLFWILKIVGAIPELFYVVVRVDKVVDGAWMGPRVLIFPSGRVVAQQPRTAKLHLAYRTRQANPCKLYP
jgi:lipid-A-disaccharide synthase-like uncharacterized protein